MKPKLVEVSEEYADVCTEILMLLMKERPDTAMKTEGAADALRAIIAEKHAAEELYRRAIANLAAIEQETTH